MITGALLLLVRGDASAFYKKRIPAYSFLSHLVCDLQSVPLDNGTAGSGAESDSGFLPLFG